MIGQEESPCALVDASCRARFLLDMAALSSPLLSSLFHIGNRISTSQKVLYLTFSTLHYNYHYNYNYNHNYKRTSRS